MCMVCRIPTPPVDDPNRIKIDLGGPKSSLRCLKLLGQIWEHLESFCILRPLQKCEAPIPMDTMENGHVQIGSFLNNVQNLADLARIRPAYGLIRADSGQIHPNLAGSEPDRPDFEHCSKNCRFEHAHFPWYPWE